MPGGFGTLDEFFEAITLIQTGKLLTFPIIIFGKAYHQDLLEHLDSMVLRGTIAKEDLSLFLVTDSIDEAVEYIHQNGINRFNLQPKKDIKPFAWLFEK